MMQQPKLSYVALTSADIATAAHLLGTVLGLPRTDCPAGDSQVPVFAVGDAALALFAPGDAFVDGQTRTGVHHIGLDFRGSPPPEMSVGVPSRSGIGHARRQALDPGTTCGVRTFLTGPLDIRRGSPALIERIDHLGIASADNQAAVATFAGRMGLPIESQQTDMEVETAIESFTSDKYGVVYHSRKPRVLGGLRVAFLTAGDCGLEFLQNFDPSHGGETRHLGAGNTQQDQGAITRFIATRGAGLHHVALKSSDINATLALLEQAGASLIDRVGRPGSRRALIGFIRPASFGGVLFHVVERP